MLRFTEHNIFSGQYDLFVKRKLSSSHIQAGVNSAEFYKYLGKILESLRAESWLAMTCGEDQNQIVTVVRLISLVTVA